MDPHPQVSLRVNFAFLTSREIRRLEIDTEKWNRKNAAFFFSIGLEYPLNGPFEKRSGSPYSSIFCPAVPSRPPKALS